MRRGRRVEAYAGGNLWQQPVATQTVKDVIVPPQAASDVPGTRREAAPHGRSDPRFPGVAREMLRRAGRARQCDATNVPSMAPNRCQPPEIGGKVVPFSDPQQAST